MSSIIVKPPGCLRCSSPVAILRAVQRDFLILSREIIDIASTPLLYIRWITIAAQEPVGLAGHRIEGNLPQISPVGRATQRRFLDVQGHCSQRIERLGIAVVCAVFLSVTFVSDY